MCNIQEKIEFLIVNDQDEWEKWKAITLSFPKEHVRQHLGDKLRREIWYDGNTYDSGILSSILLGLMTRIDWWQIADNIKERVYEE